MPLEDDDDVVDKRGTLGNPLVEEGTRLYIDTFDDAKSMVSFAEIRKRDGFKILVLGKFSNRVQVNAVAAAVQLSAQFKYKLEGEKFYIVSSQDPITP